jgi:molybdopterin converting factor subunit 1
VIRISVRLFATLREEAGVDRLPLELRDGATTEEAWQGLLRQHPTLAPRRAYLTAAVNRRYAAWEDVLAEGDEIAFIPPVSGG